MLPLVDAAHRNEGAKWSALPLDVRTDIINTLLPEGDKLSETVPKAVHEWVHKISLSGEAGWQGSCW
jgi:hypothetical protein